jgi:alkylated DNA repair dioxygenase AlkB
MDDENINHRKNILFADPDGNMLWCIENYTADLSADIGEIPLLVNPPITVRGRPGIQHRSVAFCSDLIKSYPYSGQSMLAQPLPSCLSNVMLKINSDFNVDNNAALINQYVTGEDTIGAHQDNQAWIDQSYVFAMSYGATRDFVITDCRSNDKIVSKMKKKSKVVATLPHSSCMLLCMQGPTFQKIYKHAIPVRKRVKESRTSVTFRHHNQLNQ